MNEWSRRSFLETTAAGLVASTMGDPAPAPAKSGTSAMPEIATAPSTTIRGADQRPRG